MRITWEYIAGFFDGEGSVSTQNQIHRPGSYCTGVAIAQSGDEGSTVLSAIQAFLLVHGIKGYIHHNRRGTNRPMHYYKISARPSVTLFLEAMLPRVSVKRLIVQDTLRFLKLYPSVNSAAIIERNKARGKYGAVGLDPVQLRADLAELKTLKAVGEKYGVNFYTIKKYLDPEYRQRYDDYRKKWRADKVVKAS
jgi:hypothetical protein